MDNPVLSITVLCPSCQKPSIVNDPEPGLEVVCPYCEHEFPLPEKFFAPSAPASAPAPAPDAPAPAPAAEKPPSPFATGELNLPAPRRPKGSPAPSPAPDLTLPGVRTPAAPAPRAPLTRSPAPAPDEPAPSDEDSAKSHRRRRSRSKPTARAGRPAPPPRLTPAQRRTLLVATLLLLVAVGTVIYLFVGPAILGLPATPATADKPAKPPSLATVTPDEIPRDTAEPATQLKENAVRSAERVARLALESPSWQEMTNYIRHPAALRETMRAYYRDTRYQPRRIIKFNQTTLAKINNRNLAFTTVIVDDYQELRLALEANPKEGFKLDWETMTGYQPMSWDTFRQNRPTTPVRFRVGLIASDYYDVALYDKQDYHSFKLVKNTAGANFHAYVRKDSPDGLALFDLAKDGKIHDVILDLQYSTVPGDAPDIVEIAHLVQEGWLTDPEK